MLYGRPSCSLCEHAKTLLEHAGLAFESIDISHDHALTLRWGYEIPVLTDAAGHELIKGRFDESFVAALVLRQSSRSQK